MKKFINEYLKIISYTILGLIFIIASFYLLMNYYHSTELNNHLYVSSTDLNYIKYNNTLNEINTNLNIFKSKKIKNKDYEILHEKLLVCSNLLKGEGTLSNFSTDTYHSSHDIYQLGSKFQTDLLNICYAIHLSYLTNEDAPEEFKKYSPFVKNVMNNLSYQTNFAVEEIKGNGSYFYSTNITSSTIRNGLQSDYNIVVNSYNEFANVILELSKIVNEGGEEDA